MRISDWSSDVCSSDLEDRSGQQQALAFHRILEYLRGALEAGDDGGRQVHVALSGVDDVDGLAERIARRQVERDGHRRQLALVVDRAGADVALDMGDGIERYQMTVIGADINVLQR